MKKSPKRANIARINFVAVRPLLALASDKVEREDGLSELYLPPQVPVASLPSPAVMDIRRLRRRLLEINSKIKIQKAGRERILSLPAF